jgi:hypothetical protein
MLDDEDGMRIMESSNVKRSEALKSYHRDSKKNRRAKEKSRKIFRFGFFALFFIVSVVALGSWVVLRNARGHLAAVTHDLESVKAKMSMMYSTFEQKVILYNLIDVQARDRDGKEKLTPEEKRVVVETLINCLKIYGSRGQTLALYCAIIQKESNWEKRAVSPVWEARGLMQVIDSTMKYVCDQMVERGDPYMAWNGPEDSYDIERNLRAATFYLDQIHQLKVLRGHEVLNEIGWMTLYEYYAGPLALAELQSHKKVAVFGMGYSKEVLEQAQRFEKKGLV